MTFRAPPCIYHIKMVVFMWFNGGILRSQESIQDMRLLYR